ncbi:MAG: HEAT repeat domain-containing protein [Candidatus Gastranaerophilales bacterium]|nr:HEAT repeat domain-containing protein [Candidatus Gastranaerophilales bacterium]
MAFRNFKNSKKALKTPQGLNNFKNFFTKLFNEISDLTITDLSGVSEKRALEYLERIDLSKIYTIKILGTSVKHPNNKVVIQGINALKQIRTIDSKKAICTTLNSKELNVVLEAIEALKLFTNHNVEKPLTNCLSRKNKQVANAALWALAEIKTPEALMAIESILEGNDEELAKTALWILKGTKSYKTAKKLRA